MLEAAKNSPELEAVNEVDAVESRSIGQLAAGIVRDRPWVWLRSVGRGPYVYHISVDGAFEIFRRISAQTPLGVVFLKTQIANTNQGTPIISIVVGVQQIADNQKLAIGGQDAFLVVSGDDEEELRAHGTAQALHKALRNAILNYVHLYVADGDEFIRKFVEEAIQKGKAAIIERGGKVVPVKVPVAPTEVVAKEEATGEPQEEAKPQPSKEPPTDIMAELTQISPLYWGDYLMVYTELVAKDPSIFTEDDWKDFVRWCRMPITQNEIDDLLRLISDYAEKKEGTVIDNRRDAFRYLFRYMQDCKYIEKGRRITELTQPQYRLLRQQLVSDLMGMLSQSIKEAESADEVNEDVSYDDETSVDDFPF